MKTNRRTLWFLIIFTLSLTGCAWRYLGQAQTNYEKGRQAYHVYSTTPDSLVKEEKRKEAIPPLKKARDGAKETMRRNPKYNQAYMIFLDASFMLADLDFEHYQSCLEEAYKLSKIFVVKAKETNLEPLSIFYWAKAVASKNKEEVTEEENRKALEALKEIRDKLDKEKREAEVIIRILEDRD